MVFFLCLWVQAPKTQIIHRTVTEILKVIPVTGDNEQLVSLFACTRAGDNLFLLDSDSLKIAKVGLNNKHVTFFAGAGQAPGELNPPILGFMEKEGLLRVFHSSGKRLDLFRLNGQSVSSERLDEPGSVLFLDERGTLTKDKRFKLNTKNGEEEIDAFPMKTFGFYLRTAIFLDRFYLVANKSANKDLFVFAVFDMDEGKIQGSFEVEIINKKWTNGTPDWIIESVKKEGIDIAGSTAGIFLTMLNPIVTHDKYGFLMCEEGVIDEPTFAVHIYDPRTQTRQLMRIKKGPLRLPRFFLPLDDARWVTFDSKNEEIVIFKME